MNLCYLNTACTLTSSNNKLDLVQNSQNGISENLYRNARANVAFAHEQCKLNFLGTK